MKAKAVIITLIVLCLGLSAALFLVNSSATEKDTKAQSSIQQLSGQLNKSRDDYTELLKVNQVNESNLTARIEEVKGLSNELVTTKATLAKTEADAKVAAQAAQDEMSKRDVKINDLTTQKDELTKRMNELTASISNLEEQITATEKKLNTSEKNRDFLLKELKRLQNEKAELEKQLNSLTFLREQIHKLKEEVSIQRRLDWLRRGIYGTAGQKGGERMQRGVTAPPAQTNYNLNVEIKQDGGVKITPGATNTPPAVIK